MIEPERHLNKQATPVTISKRLEDDFTSEAHEVSIPDFLENKELMDKIRDEVKPLELSVDGENTPKISTLTPIVEESKVEPELVYFESKDPKPKTVAPVGGSGPTLTKTLVKKPQADSNVHQTPPAATTQMPTKTPEEIEAEALAKEEAELKKLEDEIAQLTREAESNLTSQPGDGVGEITVIDEQTIMVDGKRKRKKKKKKKRKKIGGGEETIANITIDEVFVDEEPENPPPPAEVQSPSELKLNPAKKKKVKKHKNKITSLNTVEEDSKEQSQYTDVMKSDPIDEQDIEELEGEGDENLQPTIINQDSHTHPHAKVEETKTHETVNHPEPTFSHHKADDIPKAHENPSDNIENRWKFPEDEGMPVEFGDDNEELEEPKKLLPQKQHSVEPVGKVLVRYLLLYHNRIKTKINQERWLKYHL